MTWQAITTVLSTVNTAIQQTIIITHAGSELIAVFTVDNTVVIACQVIFFIF